MCVCIYIYIYIYIYIKRNIKRKGTRETSLNSFYLPFFSEVKNRTTTKKRVKGVIFFFRTEYSELARN